MCVCTVLSPLWDCRDTTVVLPSGNGPAFNFEEFQARIIAFLCGIKKKMLYANNNLAHPMFLDPKYLLTFRPFNLGIFPAASLPGYFVQWWSSICNRACIQNNSIDFLFFLKYHSLHLLLEFGGYWRPELGTVFIIWVLSFFELLAFYLNLDCWMRC